jgi:hypothetical protein
MRPSTTAYNDDGTIHRTLSPAQGSGPWRTQLSALRVRLRVEESRGR